MKIECPSCKFAGNAPDDKIPEGGVTVTCPKCKNKFQIIKDLPQDFTFEQTPPSQMNCPKCGMKQAISDTCITCGIIFSKYKNDQSKQEGKSVTEQATISPSSAPKETKSCHLCGEEILSTAKKCKHCNSMLDGSAPEPQKISVAQIDPFAEYHTPIKGKKKGRLTIIGYLGVGLGLLSVIAGFDIMAKDGTPNPMIIFGFGIMIGAYLWARKENDKNYVEPTILEKTGFILFALISTTGAIAGDIGIAISIMVAFVVSVIAKRKLIANYNKKPVMAIAISTLLFIFISGVAGSITKTDKKTQKTPQPTTTTAPKAAEPPAPTTTVSLPPENTLPNPSTTDISNQVKEPGKNNSPISNETVSRNNALKKAKEYLNYTAFSHDGLVAQLEHEKFSHTDAVYGADNSGGNWTEQAAKKAKEHMAYSAFSRGSLIDQLKHEKFTQEQAEYGTNAVGL